MTDAELLKMLEYNLELILDYMDDEAKEDKEAELTQYLNSAKKFITTEGITLNLNDVGDCQLVIMYASWLYDKRKAVSSGYSTSNGAMPRMLRWNLNNRLFQENVGDD